MSRTVAASSFWPTPCATVHGLNSSAACLHSPARQGAAREAPGPRPTPARGLRFVEVFETPLTAAQAHPLDTHAGMVKM